MIESRCDDRIPIYTGAFGTVFAESWFGAQGATSADVIKYIQAPVASIRVASQEFTTLWIDLTKSPEQLLAEMKYETRRLIRRAQDSQFVYKFSYPVDQTVLMEFRSFFDAFSARADLPSADLKKLEIYNRCNLLDVSCISFEGHDLAWHACIRPDDKVRLLHSATAEVDPTAGVDAGLISKGNRFLHWLNILRWQDEKLSTFDFGGLYQGTQDTKRANISNFKQTFGGQVVRTYSYSVAASFKGRLHQFFSSHSRRR